jgi:hypothetical protein
VEGKEAPFARRTGSAKWAPSLEILQEIRLLESASYGLHLQASLSACLCLFTRLPQCVCVPLWTVVACRGWRTGVADGGGRHPLKVREFELFASEPTLTEYSISCRGTRISRSLALFLRFLLRFFFFFCSPGLAPNGF